MEKEKTFITFDSFGDMRIEQEGFVGSACAERTSKLLNGLKHGNSAEQKKGEYFQKQAVDLGRISVK